MSKANLKEICPLCGSSAKQFHKDLFYLCDTCYGGFRGRSSLLSPIEEKKRYENHQNDVNDLGYQHFVSPIVNAVMRDFSKVSLGLDFGCGTGPVISEMLLEKDYKVKLYDPFFRNDLDVLKLKYDYIFACEVIEHFNNPAKEFELLKSLLKPNGHLYCMTHIYDEGVDFADWYYKNDPTHTFFYQAETLEWIKENFGFSDVLIEGRLIVFQV